jgi:Protein of unknown function (DUF2934)
MPAVANAVPNPLQKKRSPEMEEAIRRRARELWEQRGRVDGHAREDWLQAEAEVALAFAERALRRNAFIRIKVGDTIYTAEYDRKRAQGYRPGEFAPGQPLELRFEEDKMYIKLTNGNELETRIVKSESALPRWP